MFREVIGEGVFDQKSGSRERGTSWQNVATTLNAIDRLLLTAIAVRDRVTNLLKTFSAHNNSEKISQEREEQNLLNMILYFKI